MVVPRNRLRGVAVDVGAWCARADRGSTLANMRGGKVWLIDYLAMWRYVRVPFKARGIADPIYG